MGKRILYVTTVGETMSFFDKLVSKLVSEGHIVDIACNNSADDVPAIYKELGCKIYYIGCTRSPLNVGNISAIKEIRKIVSEGNYEIVHCHTPIAAACTRLACKPLRKKGVKVIYTAHGFHFYTGAPLKNWIMFYPIEKMLAKYTDVLITINGQDYERALSKMHAKKVVYVPGVGLDVNRFASEEIDKSAYRKELGIPDDGLFILSVGELNGNKNHETVIKAIADNKFVDCNIYYAIAGVGDYKDYLNKKINENGLTSRVKLLGFRKDVSKLLRCADIFIHPSFREGLPVAVMEAMASGITVVCSDIRGCQDLVTEDYLFNPKDVNSVINCIDGIIKKDKNELDNNKKVNLEKIRSLDVEEINKKVYEIYEI